VSTFKGKSFGGKTRNVLKTPVEKKAGTYDASQQKKSIMENGGMMLSS